MDVWQTEYLARKAQLQGASGGTIFDTCCEGARGLEEAV